MNKEEAVTRLYLGLRKKLEEIKFNETFLLKFDNEYLEYEQDSN